jgi:mono/diheme cytochrome c family protein
VKSLLLALAAAGVALAALGADALPAMDEAAVSRGSKVFARYCVLCHGAAGDGKGTAARAYTPAPANLVASPYPDEYKELIIRKGGSAIGRSAFMPPWGDELSEQQIRDLLVYLRRIKAKPA